MNTGYVPQFVAIKAVSQLAKEKITSRRDL